MCVSRSRVDAGLLSAPSFALGRETKFCDGVLFEDFRSIPHDSLLFAVTHVGIEEMSCRSSGSSSRVVVPHRGPPCRVLFAGGGSTHLPSRRLFCARKFRTVLSFCC